MKVIFSANTSWYLYNFRKNTIKRFIELGHEVHIIAPDDAYTNKLIDLGVQKHHLFLHSNSLNPLQDMVTILHLLYLYITIKPDVVYNFTPKINIYGAFVSYLLPSLRVVNNIAGLGTAFVDDGLKKKILHFLYKFSQKRADIVFFQNEEDMLLFTKSNLVKKEKSRRILGSGVNLEAFNTTRMTKEKDIKFILVARLIEQKGVKLYAEAARIIREKYPTAEFALLGPILDSNPSAIHRDEISKWVDAGLLNYLGHSDNVASVLAEYDCVVLPSFYREGVPKSLLEAAACGKIVITTNNIGCKDAVIDGITGFLCEPKSLEALVNALEKVIQMNPDSFIKMKKSARCLALNKFDENIIIDEYLATIKD
ncbi:MULTISPECIES: glycosyltransferase family 4 protein [Lelliottia]|uniref:glycosyltransferase family 4 protein n=1 Tax=Lelliottia TaxID=1330545 RepID=UPI000F48CBB5|nr:glycosyltransferase family 4 protein [Lelliottia sp. AC1]UQC72129.1 glycosyltransferase family 1 protein [Lelliottia sp. AC1]